ncbi:hypothetical protein [Faecalibacillus intestinalis]|uniref:hypothetical protein n=1 Tax=Faecalibacillus intestinalis TaxID=1982626 RepID=UPI0022E643CE|nr:hypothetical protein [Faecalibacillus intestinalis]
MKKKKLFLASLLSFSLTSSMFFTTNIHALEEVQNENQIEESNETLTETPSLTLVSSTWDGENDIVFNVQAKDTKVELLEMYIYSNGSSIGSIYVKPDKAVDDSGNGTITISNNELKNIKTLIGPDNQTFNWSQIEQIEMVFSFSKGEELSSFKTVYVPVHILETPTPINPDKTDKTETVKNDTNNKTTVKQTSSTAVKTGDNTNITPYVSLLVVSVVVIIGIVVYKKKSSKK